MSVYPRVCGGTPVQRTRAAIYQGLSPRVRGNLPSAGKPDSLSRSIPACAGEPGENPIMRRRTGVYPRVCGGTGSIRKRRAVSAGLSPRMRGNRINDPSDPTSEGSIPAYAGEPRRARALSRQTRVYPRVCGGTRWLSLARNFRSGLSPRMRGNRINDPSDPTSEGSIPAYAGEPRRARALSRQTRVYPRVCGGTRWLSLARNFRSGLSPRMRGNPRSARSHVPSNGSIPAYAGEPFSPSCSVYSA